MAYPRWQFHQIGNFSALLAIQSAKKPTPRKIIARASKWRPSRRGPDRVALWALALGGPDRYLCRFAVA